MLVTLILLVLGPPPQEQDTEESPGMMPCSPDIKSHCFCLVIVWGMWEGEEGSRVSSSLGLWFSEVGGNQKAAPLP